ncbi:MAG TPA: shikimate dehydrogenase [Flavobacteriaceae bacterium]|nr:shikimate dehydrogenase [Flavobacteriaceae bacterium]
MAKYGLLGRHIDYSFSRGFFNDKFAREQRSDVYVNLDFLHLEDFISWFKNQNELQGFNVTIPYKETIMSYLDELDPIAAAIGAVNTVVIRSKDTTNQSIKGYNTDYLGFHQSLEHWGLSDLNKALVLGTGGAAKAVVYALQTKGFDILQLTRKAQKQDKPANASLDGSKHQLIAYDQLTVKDMQKYRLIVNCTPVGTFPTVDQAPDLPYDALGPEHFLYDLIYNPEETEFLNRGREAGAKIKNGHQMLVLQALAAWELWQNSDV